MRGAGAHANGCPVVPIQFTSVVDRGQTQQARKWSNGCPVFPTRALLPSPWLLLLVLQMR